MKFERLNGNVVHWLACTTNIVDARKNSNTIDFKAILEIGIYFASFINSVTIFILVFLSIQFCLHLAKGCLPFVLEIIIENNKIDYKNNSNKIKTIMR